MVPTLSLRGAEGDEAISWRGMGLLRFAHNDKRVRTLNDKRQKARNAFASITAFSRASQVFGILTVFFEFYRASFAFQPLSL